MLTGIIAITPDSSALDGSNDDTYSSTVVFQLFLGCFGAVCIVTYSIFELMSRQTPIFVFSLKFSFQNATVGIKARNMWVNAPKAITMVNQAEWLEVGETITRIERPISKKRLDIWASLHWRQPPKTFNYDAVHNDWYWCGCELECGDAVQHPFHPWLWVDDSVQRHRNGKIGHRGCDQTYGYCSGGLVDWF